MNKITAINVNIRMNNDIKDHFEETFESSGANSKGEFIKMLLEYYNRPEQETRIVEKPVEIEKLIEVERPLGSNDILISLSPAHEFALRQTVLGRSDFAQRQNEIIDELKPDQRPWLYSGHLFDPEFSGLWIRNKVINSQMTAKEKDDTIKFNMSAFLLNMFLYNIADERVRESIVTANTLRQFIVTQEAKKKPVPAIPVSTTESKSDPSDEL